MLVDSARNAVVRWANTVRGVLVDVARHTPSIADLEEAATLLVEVDITQTGFFIGSNTDALFAEAVRLGQRSADLLDRVLQAARSGSASSSPTFQ